MGGFFLDGIPSKVIFRDVPGTGFEIGLHYREGYLCFYEGWHTLGSYYQLKFGGWIELTYRDPTTFDIRVKDRARVR